MELLKVDLGDHIDTAPQKSPPPGPWTEPAAKASVDLSGFLGNKSTAKPDPKPKSRPVARAQT